jgi:hypothetical protein
MGEDRRAWDTGEKIFLLPGLHILWCQEYRKTGVVSEKGPKRVRRTGKKKSTYPTARSLPDKRPYNNLNSVVLVEKIDY